MDGEDVNPNCVSVGRSVSDELRTGATVVNASVGVQRGTCMGRWGDGGGHMQGLGGYSLAKGSGVVTEEFLEHVVVTIWTELHLALLDNSESSVD